MPGPGSPAARATPPAARRAPHVLTAHGDERVDDWYWLRDRDDPEVIAYLEAENAYADADARARCADLRDRIFDEIKARVQETDESAPVPDGPWEYTSRTVEGSQYAIHCRRPRGEAPATAQVLLDENVLAAGHDYFSLGGFEVSPDHSRARVLRRPHRRRALHAALPRPRDRRRPPRRRRRTSPTGSRGPTTRARASTSAPTTRCARTRCGGTRLGTPAADDVLVFREDDERFFVGVERTRSGRFVLIDVVVEAHVGDVVRPDRRARIASRASIAPREHGHEYTVEHHRERRHAATASSSSPTGGGAPNFKLVAAPRRRSRPRQLDSRSSRTATTCKLDAVNAFARPPRAERARRRARPAARRCTSTPATFTTLALPDPVYSVWVGPNPEFDTRTLRYGYTSLVAPVTDVDYDLDTRRADGRADPARARRLRPRRSTCRPGCGRPRPTARASRSRSCTGATSPLDGTRARAALRLRLVRDLDRPVVPRVASVAARPRLRVRDRARARRRRDGPRVVRGRPARAQGEHVHRLHRVRRAPGRDRATPSPARLVARGGSAGGLLMGAVANLRPDLFAAIVAEVPFVDVVTTMLDPVAAAHDHRVGGVGRPARARRVRAHEGVLALRQRARRRLPRAARDDRAQRPARAVLGAGEVGREAARARRRRTTRSCCAPRWAPATAARRVATTRGATKRSCSRSCATRSASPRDAESLTLHTADGLEPRSRVGAARRARRATVVLCHPHPQYGGTMRSIVISALFAALPRPGIACLRFNFRGVEGSEGDAHRRPRRAPRRRRRARRRVVGGGEPRIGGPLALIGWSFGADIALAVADPRVAGWVGIAPPLRFRAERAYDAVGHDPRPKLLVLAAARRVPRARRDRGGDERAGRRRAIEVVAGASHFFVGRTEHVVTTRARDFVGRVVNRLRDAVATRRVAAPADEAVRREEARSPLDRRCATPRDRTRTTLRSPSSYACSSSSNAQSSASSSASVAAEEVIVDCADASGEVDSAPERSEVRPWAPPRTCRARARALGTGDGTPPRPRAEPPPVTVSSRAVYGRLTRPGTAGTPVTAGRRGPARAR